MDDIYSFFLRKQTVTFHANRLQMFQVQVIRYKTDRLQ